MTAVDTAPPRQRRRPRNTRETVLFFSLVLPNVLVIVVFAYYPAIYNFFLSFTDWDFLTPRPEWVGIENYTDLFASNEFYGVLEEHTDLRGCRSGGDARRWPGDRDPALAAAAVQADYQGRWCSPRTCCPVPPSGSCGCSCSIRDTA